MPEKVNVTKQKQNILTYTTKPHIELPMFFEKKPYQGASGRLYPVPYLDGITDEKKDIEYDVYTLENEYISTQLLPQIGGKILRGYDKVGKNDFMYYNRVLKPALVGIAGPWVSGGVEFNWPQHHRPTTYMPTEAIIEENSDGGKTVWMGEVEPYYRMKGMVGITVDTARSYIKAKIKVYNRTDLPQIFMWWANLAVPAHKDYRTIFPPDVEWVNDHDRRAFIEWPVAKGVYKTARPFDYGNGTDLSRWDAVKVPSSFMVSQGQSDMDFVAGYDSSKRLGIATIANHHIAPGKKMWTWGHGEFGDMWCSNLTDEDGPYIEIMTGVYTDNQPDFTWIAPFETREFEQYWYPIRDLGDVKNASIDAAMNMEQHGSNLFFAFNVTGVFPGCKIVVCSKEKVVYTETVDMKPDEAYSKTIEINDIEFNEITVSLLSAEGRKLVSYTPYVRGQKAPPAVRLPILRPREIESIEELFINGYHLEQYKQHNYDCRDYYAEALRRDKDDIRCNTAMGRVSLKNGEFKKCVEHCATAIKRLTLRNQHPADTEAIYLQGLALMHLGKYQEAYDLLYKASWSYGHCSAAHYKLAVIDCRNENYAAALEHLDISYGLNSGHNSALCIKSSIMRHIGQNDVAKQLALKVLKNDPLDLWARFELATSDNNYNDINSTFGNKPEAFLDIVCSYMEAGFYGDALHVIDIADNGSYPLLQYYRAFCLKNSKKDSTKALQKAADMQTGYCFPSRLEDIAVLEYAISSNSDDSNACYYLGNLFYDRFRYDEAIACWEESIKRNPAHAKSLRNLALGYFDKRGDFASAKICLEKALDARADSRILLEYQQLLKNTNISPSQRLAVYEKYPDLLADRDDCYLDRITLLCLQGEYRTAIAAATTRHFHIYEGGEGILTKQHAWMHVLYANQLTEAGKIDEAEQMYYNGINMPKSYGEAKTFFNQESHIYYFLGVLLQNKGLGKEAQEAFKEAAIYKATVSELSLFRALALRRLARYFDAQQVLTEMLAVGENFITNKDMRAYYGVGSPSPMPFEYDIEKQNSKNGHILKAFALLGLGKKTEADSEIEEVEKLEPFNFQVYIYKKICDKI